MYCYFNSKSTWRLDWKGKALNTLFRMSEMAQDGAVSYIEVSGCLLKQKEASCLKVVSLFFVCLSSIFVYFPDKFGKIKAAPQSGLLTINYCFLLLFLVGTRGFEPPTPWTPFRCASQTAPRPDRRWCNTNGALCQALSRQQTGDSKQLAWRMGHGA